MKIVEGVYTDLTYRGPEHTPDAERPFAFAEGSRDFVERILADPDSITVEDAEILQLMEDGLIALAPENRRGMYAA